MSVQGLEVEEDRVFSGSLVGLYPPSHPQFLVTNGRITLILVQHSAISPVQPSESLRNLQRSDGAALETQMVTSL